ncbi:facilitated trehalose transporter Tret1-like [Procambarus clarkii]|uniref:facilitated trehalose transporter Tret1-like n=1 Tax=Procambarus clarkii TaxID=6728 RepID=UPI001E6750EF|nr:facilitated trehalose transporter Tret1-like isoform X2 [Procambarus clarkii]
MTESYEINGLQEKEEWDVVREKPQERPEEPRPERIRRLARQLGLVSLASFSYFSLGAALPWPSPALSDLAENNSTLFGTEISLNSAEKDMTGSLLYLGTLVGAWVSGWVVAKIGRLRSMQAIVVPYLGGWIIVALAPSTPVLLIGRFIIGLACGGTTIAGYSYVIELSDVSVRGMAATIPTMGVVLGGLYTVCFGYVLPWHYLSMICALPPLLFFLVTFVLPMSPSFLVVQGRRQQAIVILKQLRGNYANVELEVSELERRNAVSDDGRRGGWRDLLQRDVLRPIIVVVVLFLLMQLCGNFVFMIYTARILEATGAPMDPDAITAIAGALRVAGTLAAILLLDIVGRRYLLIISHAINAVCLIILGAYAHLADNADPDDTTYKELTWVPTVCVTVALFICDIGVHPVPYIVASEYFPTRIRAQASSVCISAGTAIIFMTLQLYSPMQAAFTQAGLYWFYGATSIIGVVFCFYAVTETKGKSVG